MCKYMTEVDKALCHMCIPSPLTKKNSVISPMFPHMFKTSAASYPQRGEGSEKVKKRGRITVTPKGWLWRRNWEVFGLCCILGEYSVSPKEAIKRQKRQQAMWSDCWMWVNTHSKSPATRDTQLLYSTHI